MCTETRLPLTHLFTYLFLFFFIFIDIIGVTLANKITWVSRVQLYNKSSVYLIVYSPSKVKSLSKTKNSGMDVEKKCKWMQPLWKTVRSFFKKLKMELPYDPAILLLGIYLKKPETLFGKSIYTTVFITALCRIAKI